jgi:hypothetical protein
MRGEDHRKSVGDKVALVRATIRTLLRQHLSKSARRPEAQVTLRLTVDGDGYLSKQYETHDVRDALAYVLVLELAQFSHRLRRCAAAKCQRIFVRERRQKYCSAACRNRTSFKQWYRRQVFVQTPGSGKSAFLIRLRRLLGKGRKRKERRASA